MEETSDDFINFLKIPIQLSNWLKQKYLEKKEKSKSSKINQDYESIQETIDNLKIPFYKNYKFWFNLLTIFFYIVFIFLLFLLILFIIACLMIYLFFVLFFSFINALANDFDCDERNCDGHNCDGRNYDDCNFDDCHYYH